MHYNTKLGLILFAIYLLLYGGFVLLNSFVPQAMEQTPLAGINVAILYGFGLIISAFVLALIYGISCRPDADEQAMESSAPTVEDSTEELS